MNRVGAAETTKCHPRADECRAQLDKILSSPAFAATEREHRFLAYIVDEAASGRGSRIKAYSVAVEVFERDASFDAQHDPIVRIAAGNLRRSLERYYLTAGRCDRVEITIPKGSYIPAFTFKDEHRSTLPITLPGETGFASPIDLDSKAYWRGAIGGLATAVVIMGAILFLMPAAKVIVPLSPEVPRILIARLEDLTQSGSSPAIASGLTQEIVAQLSKFRDIVVLQVPEGVVADPPPRFTLVGSVQLTDAAFRLTVRFVDLESSSVLWANSFDGPLKPSELVRAKVEIASNVATTLAQSYGVVFQADAKRNVSNAPDDWAAYSCTLSYYSYRAYLDKSALPDVRKCLEKAVARFPDYATAWALLAQTYLEEIRFRVPYDGGVPAADLDRALETARHAVRLDPYNTRGMQAEMFALFFGKQFEAGKKVGEKALSLNPNDTELMGEYGYRLALSGEWKEGCALIAEARLRNPGIFGYYESGLALCSYFSGDSENAVMWIKKSGFPANALYHLIAAAIFAEANLTDDSRKQIVWLCVNQPELLHSVRREASARLGRSADVQRFIQSVAKAQTLVPYRSCPLESARSK